MVSFLSKKNYFAKLLVHFSDGKNKPIKRAEQFISPIKISVERFIWPYSSSGRGRGGEGGKNYAPFPLSPLHKNVNNDKNRQAAGLPGFFTA